MHLILTVDHPHDEVRNLICFAAQHVEHPFDPSQVIVKVKNSRKWGYRGTAYPGIPKVSKGLAGQPGRLVTIGIGPAHWYPFVQSVARKPIEFNTWQEGLVFVAAHEFEHIRQFAANEKPTEWASNRVGLKALEAYVSLKNSAAYRKRPGVSTLYLPLTFESSYLEPVRQAAD